MHTALLAGKLEKLVPRLPDVFDIGAKVHRRSGPEGIRARASRPRVSGTEMGLVG